jgi:hypothetical protein
MEPDKTANEPTEEQVLNFLVNTLDEEIGDVFVGAEREPRRDRSEVRLKRSRN